jgi:hypothetical protein
MLTCREIFESRCDSAVWFLGCHGGTLLILADSWWTQGRKNVRWNVSTNSLKLQKRIHRYSKDDASELESQDVMSYRTAGKTSMYVLDSMRPLCTEKWPIWAIQVFDHYYSVLMFVSRRQKNSHLILRSISNILTSVVVQLHQSLPVHKSHNGSQQERSYPDSSCLGAK